MIPTTQITEIFDTLATYLNTPIWRANQTKPTEDINPHGIYNILSDQNEHAYQNVVTRTNNTDPTKVNNNLYEKSKMTISLMFADKNRIDRIALLCTNAMHWFKIIAGQEYCNSRGIIVNLINNNIQDRTVWVEHLSWENRYGFDLQFLFVNKFVDVVEDIEIIKITPSPEGVDQSEISVPV